MPTLDFELDFTAFLIALPLLIALIFFARHLTKQFLQPAILFSDTSLITITKNSWKVRMAHAPLYLSWSAFALFTLAFIDPHFYMNKAMQNPDDATEGIAMYLVVDRSGSMASNVGTTSQSPGIVKLNLLKQITEQFINGNAAVGLSGRQNDLIGLVAFARTAQVLSPLTLDHAKIVQELNDLNVVQNKDEDGTGIGYALYKTVNIIAATRNYVEDLPKSDIPAYEIKNSIIILVTDGFDSPHFDDLNHPLRGMAPLQAALYAKENKVRIYIINIEPALSASQFAPQRHQMEDIASDTGGKYYLMTDPAKLPQIYTEIEKIEKSLLPSTEDFSKDLQPQKYQRVSIYSYLIGLGMVMLLTAALLETFGLRRVP